MTRDDPNPLDTTRALLDQVRAGDDSARDRLVRRFLPGLRRWAHGRLPDHARRMLDTDDLVQVSILRALDRVDEFEAGRAGAFLSYLHRILLNCVRDEIRRVQVRPEQERIADAPVDARAAVLETTLGPGTVALYERALASLGDELQQAIILRVEFGFTYQEIADALGRPSANTVRMQLTRGLVRLAEAMHDPPH